MTEAERQQLLQSELLLEVAQGNRVAWLGLCEAHVWEQPPPINHTLHVLATFFTGGIWLPFWLLRTVLQPKPKLVGIAVDECGQIHEFVPTDPAPGRHRRRPAHS